MVEIQLNESESHTIEVPENMTAQQFLAFAARIEKLARMISKDDEVLSAVKLLGRPKKEQEAEEEPVEKKERKEKKQRKKRKPRNVEAIKKIRTRRILVQLLSAYYCKTEKGFWRAVKKFGLDDYITKRSQIANQLFMDARRDFEIMPKEIGLVRFPTRDSPRPELLK